MATFSISLTRGDSASYLVSATSEDGVQRPFVQGDTVYMTIKKDTVTADILVQKRVTEFDEQGRANIVLEPSDTKDLDYGSYKYDIQLTTETGLIQTIIKPSSFKLTGEVTFE